MKRYGEENEIAGLHKNQRTSCRPTETGLEELAQGEGV